MGVASTHEVSSMLRCARRWIVGALSLSASLAITAPAWGHAVISPPVVQSASAYVFSLSVPTERADRQTVSVELTVPSGFAIDSFAAARGWKRRVAATGTGEDAVVNKVIWSGGATPIGETAVFQFNATAVSERTYTFAVRQTYDDGSVVDWSGAERSDTPAPRIEAEASLGGNGDSTIPIIALLVGSVGVVLAVAALLARRGDRPVT
jgi:uncharacterized protein YcnI